MTHPEVPYFSLQQRAPRARLTDDGGAYRSGELLCLVPTRVGIYLNGKGAPLVKKFTGLFPYMVVPPKHPKMLFFLVKSRFTCLFFDVFSMVDFETLKICEKDESKCINGDNTGGK